MVKISARHLRILSRKLAGKMQQAIDLEHMQRYKVGKITEV
jgi:hypothetical protein